MKKAVALEIINNKKIPRILASARGKLAEKIIEIAKEKNIEIFEDKDLVESLYQVREGSYIPEDLYKIVTEVVLFCYNVNSELRKDINDVYFQGNI